MFSTFVRVVNIRLKSASRMNITEFFSNKNKTKNKTKNKNNKIKKCDKRNVSMKKIQTRLCAPYWHLTHWQWMWLCVLDAGWWLCGSIRCRCATIWWSCRFRELPKQLCSRSDGMHCTRPHLENIKKQFKTCNRTERSHQQYRRIALTCVTG